MASHDRCFAVYHDADLLVSAECKGQVAFDFARAIFATIGWMLLSQVFGLYARYFAAKIIGYQIIGSFIVLMIWLNLAATIIILGGIINAVVEEYVSGQEIKERTDPVQRISSKIEDTFTNKEK